MGDGRVEGGVDVDIVMARSSRFPSQVEDVPGLSSLQPYLGSNPYNVRHQNNCSSCRSSDYESKFFGNC